MELFSRKTFNETDWIGRWYQVAKSLGRNDINIFGRALWNPKTHELEQIERLDFSHSLMDGAGAMVTYMHQLGDSSVEYPRSDRNTPPPLAQRPKIFLNSQKLMSKARARWKLNNGTSGESPDDNFYVFAFDHGETIKLRSHCKEQGVSTNAWLIHHLQNVAAELLLEPDSQQAWLVPVNMRGGVNKPNPAMNQSSAVPLFVSRQDSPQFIYEQLKARLKDRVQWGNWWAYSLGALLGEKSMKRLYAKSSKKNFWMGTMSDMGPWTSGPGYQELGDNEIWFATPPGSQNYPIGCVQFTFNGKLSITLKVHPSICATSNPSKDLAIQLEKRLRESAGLSTGVNCTWTSN